MTYNFFKDSLNLATSRKGQLQVRDWCERDYRSAQQIFKTRYYCAVTDRDVEKFLEVTNTDKIKWQSVAKGAKQHVVCSFFASQLAELAWEYALASGVRWRPLIGVLATDKHAVCFYYTPQGKFRAIEPQTDVVYKGLEEWKGYIKKLNIGTHWAQLFSCL